VDLFEPQATVGDEAEDSETGNCQASGNLGLTNENEGEASDKKTRK
jgi:hypothetical protein